MSAASNATPPRAGPIEFVAVRRTKGLIVSMWLALSALLVLAPGAMAADGVGLWGRTDDKVITFFAFAVIAFFAILVTVFSLIQIRLENRKERARQDLERVRR
jgi:hypothetical protein